MNLNEKEEQLYVNKKTRQALLDTNKGLKERIAELEDELNQNTVTLVEIINQVKLKTKPRQTDRCRTGSGAGSFYSRVSVAVTVAPSCKSSGLLVLVMVT